MRLFPLILWFCCTAFAQEATSVLTQLIDSANGKYMRGEYPASRQLFEQALQGVNDAAPEDAQRYDILKHLVFVNAATNDFEAANRYLEDAIAWRERVNGKDDPKIADDLLVRVNLFRGMKDFAHARETLEAVMRVHTVNPGFDTVTMADDFSRLGQVETDVKNMESAAQMFQAAIRIRGKLAGPLDVSLVPDLDHLGHAQLELRKYEDAEATYRHSLVIRESIFGADGPDLIASLDGLAYSCFGQKKYDEAEPMYKRLIALWVSSTGPDHPMLALALDKMAAFYADQKKFDQSRKAAEHANAIRASFLAAGLTTEGAMELQADNPAAVVPLYQRAIGVLDPPNTFYDEFRKQIAGNLANLEEALPEMNKRKNVEKTSPKK